MASKSNHYIRKIYAGPPSAYRPIRARLAGQWDAGLKNISIIWISGRMRGGIIWVNPSSKCASCHSNEMYQRIIHTHVNVSSKAYVYDENIYNFCARARFAGCTYLRHIILGLNTVPFLYTVKKGYRFSQPQLGCHLPNSPWPGKIQIFPARESLVSDFPAGDGKTANLYSVGAAKKGSPNMKK